ncbi:MAG: hypothetical protein KDD82_07830 [Planctomycetes bacterium]|nr:hypothetical protein [Planctomycetota bacterium]
MRPAATWAPRPALQRLTRLLLVVSAVVLTSLPGAARSTTVEALDEDALLERSACVFWGDCLEARPEWSADRQRIYTRVRFAPREVLKGDPAPLVELLIPGGELEGKAYVIHGMPTIRAGSEVVLFASHPHPKSKVCVPVGLGQGVYFVNRRADVAQARRDTRDLRVLAQGEARSRPGKLEVVELDALLGRLRSKVRGGRPR